MEIVYCSLVNAFLFAKARLEYEKEDIFSLIYETLCMYNIVPLKEKSNEQNAGNQLSSLSLLFISG